MGMFTPSDGVAWAAQGRATFGKLESKSPISTAELQGVGGGARAIENIQIALTNKQLKLMP